MSSFDFGSDKTPQEIQRLNILKFLSNHKKILQESKETIVEDFSKFSEFRDYVKGPIKITFTPSEYQRFDEMIHTPHKILEKLVTVFSNLIYEMKYLEKVAEEEIFPVLSIFGDRPPEENSEEEFKDDEDDETNLNEKRKEWKNTVEFSRMISFLSKLWNYLKRIETVVNSVIQQLCVFFKFKNSDKRFINFKKTHLISVFSELGSLLKSLFTIDTLIKQNPCWKNYFIMYQQMLNNIMKYEKKYELNKVHCERLLFLLQKIQFAVLEGNCFQNLINKDFSSHESEIDPPNNTHFQSEFIANLIHFYSKSIADPIQKRSTNLLSVYCLLTCYLAIWKGEGVNKKLVKLLWEQQKKTPIFYLFGNSCVSIFDFFVENLTLVIPIVIKPKNLNTFLQKHIAKEFEKIEFHEAKLEKFKKNVVIWYAKMHSSYKSTERRKVQFNESLLLEGLTLAFKISGYCKKFVYLHIKYNRNLKLGKLISICKCIELLKEIELTFSKTFNFFGGSVSAVFEKNAFTVQNIIRNIITKFEKSKKLSEFETDNLNSLKLSLSILNGAPTQKRCIASRLAIDFSYKQVYSVKDFQSIQLALKKIEQLASFDTLLKEATNCSFIYWSQDIATIFFKYIFENPERAYQLPLMFYALEDCKEILEKAIHLDERENEIDWELKEIDLKIKQEIEEKEKEQQRLLEEKKKAKEEEERKKKEEERKLLEEADEAVKKAEKQEEEGEEGEIIDVETENENEEPPKEESPIVGEELPIPSDELPPIPEDELPPIPEDELPPIPGEDLPMEEEKEIKKKEKFVETKKKNMILREYFEKEMKSRFHKTVLYPVCLEIEKYLRLNVISNNTRNYDPNSGKIIDLDLMLMLEPICFFDSYINIKDEVCKYLTSVFYEYTIMQQTDWKIFEEMRNLCFEKFGIQLIDSYLPKQITHQGEDLLDITQNIKKIVKTYCYNFNNNMFVQRSDKLKTAQIPGKLKTILVHHVSNSIRTHGTGIMNTAVDWIFRFLKKKFFAFLKFLHDDNINGRLVKDVRYYKQNHLELNNMYPMERAIDFQLKIKKLGILENNMTFLDKFRDSIIEIGNALGYVRMIRAGGLRHVSSAVTYVPDLDSLTNFKDLSNKETFSDNLKNVGNTLNSVLENYSQRFFEGSDYFNKLVSAFTTLLKEKPSLKYFYVIIPPLTLSFIDDIIYGKEQMERKSRFSKFTNDGFALGISFILKVLNQNQEFNSLNWFDSVKEYYDHQSKLTKNSSLARTETYKKEMELLFYQFYCTKVFLS